jgi:hypothetical protein
MMQRTKLTVCAWPSEERPHSSSLSPRYTNNEVDYICSLANLCQPQRGAAEQLIVKITRCRRATRYKNNEVNVSLFFPLAINITRCQRAACYKNIPSLQSR